ncbi:diguanylate cyclase/phosphodiesterase (GGDEF & EAL domains) with PAS/PAC sensor(s) [hydrothermal vent metagenome]|uniref:Diguanylate cyclase/phosphodiesterase (GGDEF & EAL domains) with PAS/PAC sensor(S) n=1 Tax=hydrothermal vent metagenome TaxID=652676 RepID=A0A3B0VM95_9ZZZZ
MHQINQLKKRYISLVSDQEALLALIAETEVSEQVYNSNAIENSTLSLDETEKILLQIDLDRFINERELFEAKNLARVVAYINKKASQKRISIELILLLHKMLLGNIRNEIAGRFRTKNEWVKVAGHIAPNPKDVPDLVKSMLIEYQVRDDLSMVERIATLHLTFEQIHPFVDGNGRIGRVINNYMLIRDGYVPINIKFNDRDQYYQSFMEFNSNGTTKIMQKIVQRALLNSYHKRLAYMEDKKIIKLSEYAKTSKQSHSNLLNKANRQTIEAFMERGVWKIGTERIITG